MSTLEEARTASLAKYKAAVKAVKMVYMATQHRQVDQLARERAIEAARVVWHAEMAALDHPVKVAPAASDTPVAAVKAMPAVSENDG
jgi:hypothetical protein